MAACAAFWPHHGARWIRPGHLPVRICFFVTDRTGTQQIWLRSSDGQWERPLVTEEDFGDTGTQLLETPAFSPDGQRLAYFHSGTERGASKIWISTLAGGPPVELTPMESQISVAQDAPTWSPDGNWVAYVYWFGGPDQPSRNAGLRHWGLAKAQWAAANRLSHHGTTSVHSRDRNGPPMDIGSSARLQKGCPCIA